MIETIYIEEAVRRSQHCQRNWDLSKIMPQEDIETIIVAATECPSKQNIAFYSITAITNRATIEAVHGFTQGFTNSTHPKFPNMTNTQTLANLLLVFEEHDFLSTVAKDIFRSYDTDTYLKTGSLPPGSEYTLRRDCEMAIGIASGYANLTASLLGYNTGFCACFNQGKVQECLKLKGLPRVMLGIGFDNLGIDRCVHQTISEFIYTNKPKYPITVNRIV